MLLQLLSKEMEWMNELRMKSTNW